MQHVLYQRARLHGEVGIHLLQGRIVACGQVKTLDTVISGHTDFGCSIVVIGFQLPLATETQQHHKNQYSVSLAHGYFELYSLIYVKNRCKITKKYLKSKF